jgi:hypothetical protein
MIHNLIIVAACLLFILTFYIDKTEGFYDPTKDDQRLFEMDNHAYDGDLFQSEKLLYDMIIGLDASEKNLKDHLGELLNILQFI